jgi:hypothetical protein
VYAPAALDGRKCLIVTRQQLVAITGDKLVLEVGDDPG